MSFVTELKRRNVFKVGVAYAIVAWLLIQVAAIVLPTFDAPRWVLQTFTFLIILGFPLALFLAWAFELTPEGIKPTRDVDKAQSITRATGHKLNYTIIVLLAVALIYVMIDNYVLREDSNQEAATNTVQETKTPVQKQPVAVENKKSVAVLPFANMSDSKEDAYFADGVQDDILTQLTNITSLKVISRTSVMGYRNTTKNVKTIGKELGVANVLEGGVQRAGKQIRINVQLIDADKDRHLWAKIYDRKLTAENIFSIQSEIATAIANALRAALSPQEKAKIDAVPTQNLEALEAYFKGKQAMVARTSEGLAAAVNYFQEAIKQDPDFALAYVGLADTYQLQKDYSGLPKAEMDARAQAAIDKALSLNDNLGEAYASLGLLKEENNENAAAEVAFNKALRLNPNYASAYIWYGNLKDSHGKFNAALAQFHKGVELDPLSAVLNVNIADNLTILGRFQEALAQYDKTIAIAPQSPAGYTGKGFYYWGVTGQLDKAASLLHKSYNLDPDNPDNLTNLAYLYWDLGDDGQAACWARRAEAMAPQSYAANNVMFWLNIMLGDEAQTLTYARKSVQIEPRGAYPGPLAVLGDHDIQTGHVQEARERYQQAYPELFPAEPRVGLDNLRAAINLAALLLKTGHKEHAEQLLNAALTTIKTSPRLGAYGFGISDVAIYALQGKKQQALAALRQAVDAGWHVYWRPPMKYNTNLDTVRNTSEFKAEVAELKTEMAGQLARVKQQKTAICK